MKIYKKKLANAQKSTSKEYFESPFLQDMCKNKNVQYSGDIVEKFSKKFGVDQYSSGYISNPLLFDDQVPISTLADL